MIYTFDILHFLSNVLPVRLRSWSVLRFVQALLQGVVSLHADFLAWRQAQLSEVYADGTVWQLERLLNDRFDGVLRRIFISDGDLDYVQFWKPSEGPYVQFWKPNEGPYVHFAKPSEMGGFVVNIPLSLVISLNLSEVRAVVTRYKLAGTFFTLRAA